MIIDYLKPTFDFHNAWNTYYFLNRYGCVQCLHCLCDRRSSCPIWPQKSSVWILLLRHNQLHCILHNFDLVPCLRSKGVLLTRVPVTCTWEPVICTQENAAEFHFFQNFKQRKQKHKKISISSALQECYKCSFWCLPWIPVSDALVIHVKFSQ